MDNYLQQNQDYSILLLQNEDSFPVQQSIVNFTPNQSSINQKGRICAWNQHSYVQDRQYKELRMSPGFDSQKHRIQQFLSTIRMKNGQFPKMRSKLKYKKKNSLFDRNNSLIDNPQNQKNQLFLPLNNTIITFPKSRSQNRKLQNQQKIILQKLYRKRQKSKIIPKQIFIDPLINTIKPNYPSKDYLSKNRSFIQDSLYKKVHYSQNKPNQQKSHSLKTNKQQPNGLRRRFSNSYYKKLTGVFQLNGDNQKLYEIDPKNNIIKKQLQKMQKSKKANSLHDQNDNYAINKMYKTLYNNSKFNTNFPFQKQFSIDKIRQQAKITHLNRIKIIQDNQIQLLGSTITKWKNRAEQKLKNQDFLKQENRTNSKIQISK